MALLRTLKSAFSLFIRGEWREFYIRALIVSGILDIKTITTDELDLPSERSHSYSDSGREDLQNVLSSLEIKDGDSILDFGCGKGGALMVMADYPFSRVTGVEISSRLVQVAKRNLDILRIKNVEVVCADATEFHDLDDYNYFYFYNPFPCSVMLEVQKNIQASLLMKPRKVFLIYLNPVCHDPMVENGVFWKVREFEHFSHEFYLYSNYP